jgi:hypothetical protein
MRTFLIIIVLLLLQAQVLKAQTFVTLPQQSNCPTTMFVDYIAKGVIQQKQLIISGELVVTGDSLVEIIFSLEKPFESTIKQPRYMIDCNIEKAIWIEEKKEFVFISDKTKNHVDIKLTNNMLMHKVEVTTYIALLEKKTDLTVKKTLSLVLACSGIYKNGCRFIKRQKIIINSL